MATKSARALAAVLRAKQIRRPRTPIMTRDGGAYVLRKRIRPSGVINTISGRGLGPAHLARPWIVAIETDLRTQDTVYNRFTQTNETMERQVATERTENVPPVLA